MYRHRLGIVVSLLGGLLGVAGMLALLGNIAGGVAPAEAGTDAVLTVCPAGPPACDYAVIQEAVDAAAEGDVIKVATGVYTGVHPRPGPGGSSVITQVVYISKSLSLQGGYTVTDWIEPDPELNPTIVDAQGEGRVVTILGPISVTVQGLHITGGDAAGLGAHHVGGGVAVSAATVAIRDNVISDNRADYGGGMNLNGYSAHLSGNLFTANAARDDGGGLHAEWSHVLAEGNTFYTNTADYGGGLEVHAYDVRLVRNTVIDNRADMWGGGLAAYQDKTPVVGNLFVDNHADEFGPALGAREYPTFTVEGNQFISNTAYLGGGVAVWVVTATLQGNLISGNYGEAGGGGALVAGETALLEGNRIIANRSGGQAGGLWIFPYSFRVRNNVIADNEALGVGGGLVTRVFYEDVMVPPAIELVHNTIARNRAADGTGVLVWVEDSEPGQTLTLTNTILVSQTVGISVTAGSTATLEGTLWGAGAWGNETDWAGEGTIVTGTVNVWGDPAFADPAAGDYHIGPGSAAIDAGIDAGVTTDIDGDPRPAGAGYDLGADELPSTRYVATDGADTSDCSTPAGRCLTVQYAVDQAWEGDEVRVAGGVYTGVRPRPAPPGYEGPAVITQVVYISKSLSLQGGYTVTNWTEPDPELNPTILDAQGQGRVMMIAGSITVTVQGLEITGGDAAGLGDYPDSGDGGGIAVQDAAVTIRDNRISDNRAYGGAGVDLFGAEGQVMGNTFIANAASGFGGGLNVYQSDALVEGNTFYTNTAEWNGGGLMVYQNDVRVIQNLLVDNHAELWGGGISAYQCLTLTIEGNQVISNTAINGGGMFMTVVSVTLRGNLVAGNYGEFGDGGLSVDGDDVTVDGNTIVANGTGERGGGLTLGAVNALVSNNIIADNEALVAGGGLLVVDGGETSPGHVDLIHNTIARNRAGDGSGLLVVDWSQGSTAVSLTNTILVSHSVGISVSAGNTVTLEGTLWGSGAWGNETDWGGDGTILTGTINLWAEPAFIDPDAGDYHIGPGSAAIDAGVDAGVNEDVDGQPRPVGMGYDMGADEVQAALFVTKTAFPDPVLAGRPLTYTLAVTNNGLVTLTVAVTDTLPPEVTPTGVLTWSVGALSPGDDWGAQVVVTVAADYGGVLTNVLRAGSAEGAAAAYTLTTTAYRPVQANFAGMPTAGVAPLTVTFTNTSTGDYSTSLWLFGDGVTSTLQHPTHTYGSAGAYTVTLTVSGPGGTDTLAQGGCISVYEPVEAGFAAEPTSGIAPLTVTFTNTSTGDYDTSLWRFGDGITSTLTSPTHTYTAAGVYTVTLTIDGPGGTDTEIKERYITVQYGVYVPVILRSG